jgi:fimbrial isopeptide formation D2 family protein
MITKNVQKINKMFKKIVTNLPFHPTLLGDLGYYLRRVRQEQAIRRLGLIFVSLALLVQLFAFLSPVKSSIAYNTGDIIYGATSKEDVVKAFKNNKDPKGRTDVKAIFDYYGIGLDQIQNSKKTTISDSDNDKYVNTSRSPIASGSYFVKVPGAIDGGIYEFPLKYWNKSEFPNGYPALTGISTYGFRFWILLKGCGNVVIERGSKHPKFEIDKKLISSQSVQQGDKVQYKIEFRNSGIIASENVRIVDTLDDNLKFDSYTSNIDLKKTEDGQKIVWEVKGQDNVLKPSDRWHKIVFTAVVKKSAKNNTKICNQAIIRGTKTKDVSSGGPKDCVTITTTPTCPGTGLPIPPGGIEKCNTVCQDGSVVPYNQPCPTPNLSCQSLKEIAVINWNKRKFETKILKQPGAEASAVNYFVNSSLVAKQQIATGASTDYFTYEFPAQGDYKVKSEVLAANGSISVPSQSCEMTVKLEKPVNPLPRLVTDKGVSNESQNIADANNTTASAGDLLAYKLFVENTGDAVAEGFSMTGEYAENISDILEYADLVDNGGGIFNEATGVLSWDQKINIQPGQKIEKVFKVKVKDPLPATPISASNPLSYDFAMTNIYGREVTVKLNKPASKDVEIATTTLPNTGPGSTMLISVIFVTIIAFFYYRSRLLGKEIEIVRYEYSTGGL